MKIDFDQNPDGLVPVVVQDSTTRKILLVGFMNRKAYRKTEKSGKVTFFSRKKKKLWTKGEASENYLKVDEILTDCNQNSILIKATPEGSICHKGSNTCFNEVNKSDNFLKVLEKLITEAKVDPIKMPQTNRLFQRGVNQIAKKVGEEAVELVIEAVLLNNKLFKEEASDLLYYFTALLVARGIELEEIIDILKKRHDPPKS